MLSILPKDIQKYIWKLVNDDMLEKLKINIGSINYQFDCIEFNEKRPITIYEYFRFYDKKWCVLFRCGKREVSNIDQIDNFLISL